MFIRPTFKTVKGKTYTNYVLVESVATAKGPRQKTICSLGNLQPRPAEEWLRLARKVEDALRGQVDMFEAPEAQVESLVAKVREREAGRRGQAPARGRKGDATGEDVVCVHTDQVSVEECREAGPEHVGLQFWDRLGLGEILGRCGLKERDRRLACVMTLNRLIKPLPEWAMPGWVRRTALGDLLRADFGALSAQTLYREMDRLHPHRRAIESALAERERTLFNLDATVYLYDLTSTYFEGQALQNPLARRGYSRDKRPDCKQVVVGLVVNRDGFPLAHEVYAGNTQDCTTVETTLDQLARRVELEPGQTVVVDRGMAFPENLAAIRRRGLHYMAAARQSERDAFLRQIEDDEGFVEVLRQPSPTNPAQKKTRVRVKLCAGQGRTDVLCLSDARVEKDRAIRRKQEERFLADVAGLQKSVEKGRERDEKKIHERIGRLKERYPRVARYWRLAYEPSPPRVVCPPDEAQRQKAETLDGSYLLRTDRTDLTAEEAWRVYMLLSRIEAAFRAMKSPLAERPIHHHFQHRVETHIFLCVLAYHLLVAIEKTLLDQNVHTSWDTVRQTLSTHQLATVVLPADGGATLKIRQATAPEPPHRELYRLLDVPAHIIRPRKTWTLPEANP
jgi:transposase